MLQFKLGSVVQGEPEAVGEQQCFCPCVRVCVGVGGDVEQRQVVERRPAKLRIDAASADGNGRLLATSSRQSAGTSDPYWQRYRRAGGAP